MFIEKLNNNQLKILREPGQYIDFFAEVIPKKTWTDLQKDGQVSVIDGCLERVSADIGGILLLPESITSIGDNAMRDSKHLTNIILPNTIKSIGLCALPENTNLNIYLSNKLNIFRAQFYLEEDE